MKLETAALDCELSPELKAATFSIEANAIAFKLLSDKLYSNKIDSLVRELCCNAYDSHVEAGKANIPFQVKLPNTLEPNFVVKDFGVGLSPDRVKDVYTTLFKSTKSSDPKSIGAYGLGSKTPLLYTDNFTVNSVFNGTKYIYNVFLNAAGIPSYTLVHSSPSSEVNGVEIVIAVNRYDFKKFEQVVQRTLAWFKPLPVVTGVADFSFAQSEFLFENELYAVLKNPDYNQDAVYLNHFVPYTCTGHLGRMPIIIKGKIGDVDLTTSRESIELSPRTISFLQKLDRQIRNRLRTDIKNYIDGLRLDKWDQLKWNQEISKNSYNLYNFLNSHYSLPTFINLGKRVESYSLNRNQKLKSDDTADLYPDDTIYYDDKNFNKYVKRAKVRTVLSSSNQRLVVLPQNFVYAGLPFEKEVSLLSTINHNKVRTAYVRKNVYCYTLGKYGSKTVFTYDATKQYIYAALNKTCPTNVTLNNKLYSLKGLHELVAALEKNGYMKYDFVIITEASEENARKLGWTHLDQILNQVRKDFPKIEEEIENHDLKERLLYCLEIADSNGSELSKFLHEVKQIPKLSSEQQTLFCKMINLYELQVGKKLLNKWNDICRKYPLFHAHNGVYNHSDHIKKYTLAVDKGLL